MAEEAEKRIEEMKKECGDIIMKSSKEAATRIMRAEHKARSIQQQLVSLKEDSLSMLVRFKQHYNSMILETEAKSLKQQMKIDELEAQLNEAEGIILDLRSELEQVQEQLEIERQSRKKSSDELGLVTNDYVPASGPQDDVPNSSVISQVRVSKSDLIDYENNITSTSVHPRLMNTKFFKTLDSTCANFSVESHLDQFHAPNDDLSSIILQNRESDLLKNGCTQRIRAIEGNLSNVKLTLPPSEDKKFFSHVQPLMYGEKTVNCGQYGSEKVYSSSEPLCSSETDKSNAKNIQFGWLKQRRSSRKPKANRSRRSAWKNTKYREAIASLKSSRKKFVKPQLKPLLSPLKRCYNVVNVETVEIPIGLMELDPKKTNLCQVSTTDNFNFNSENSAACSSSGQSLGFHDDILSDSMLVDVPILEGFGTNHCHSRFNKALKFTFQRRRRKNVSGKNDENITCERLPVKGLEDPADVAMGEIAILKDGKYGNCGEMNQVANQLISSTGVEC